MKKISIITVCFNSEEYIEQTILSVLDQTYQNIEYIIIDGNSKDQTVDIIKKYSHSIHYWVSEPDKGIYDAMNKGIAACSGDWILFMNAGDNFYSKDVLEKVFDNEIPEDTGIIYGDVELDFGTSRTIRSLRNFNNDSSVVTEICHQGMLTRADILKKIKYDLNFKIMADVNSFVKIFDMGYRFKYVPVVFSTFEATMGISATKPFLLLSESCKIRGINKFSIIYAKMYLKTLFRYILFKVLPTSFYNTVRYKKVSLRKEYK